MLERVFSNPGFRYFAVLLLGGLGIALIPFLLTINKYLRISDELGYLALRVMILSLCGIFLFIFLLAEFFKLLIYLQMRFKGSKEFFANYVAKNTYVQVSNYFGLELLKPRVHVDVFWVADKSGLVCYSSYRSVKQVFVIKYGEIIEVKYIPAVNLISFMGFLPGVEIVLSGSECFACGTGGECTGHVLQLGIARPWSVLFMRMSQEESYRRFEEFRDRVMEMKRLNSGG